MGEDPTETYNLEDVIRDIGGCGRYQVRLSTIVHCMKTVCCWSIFSMVFAAATPRWTCADDLANETLLLEDLTNGTLALAGNRSDITWEKSCKTRNGTTCTSFLFDTSEMSTIVSEWSLVCDLSWVPATIASIQMAGLFVGNIFSGHLADALGRKMPLYLSILILIVFNVVSFLATSWITFAVARFFLGVGSGFFLTIQYNIQSEVALSKWRALIVAVPSWFIQQSMFAGVAWLVPNWAQLHLVTGIVGVPFLFTWWIVPESFRWLVAHNRMKEAEYVIAKIADVNRRRYPEADVMECMTQEAAREAAERSNRKYTVVDLFRTRHLVKISLLFILEWFTLGFVAYAIQYSISALSGNLFLNMFLFGIASSPTSVVSIVLANTIGRRKDTILCYIITLIGCVGVAITQTLGISLKTTVVNAFALVAFLGISTAWAPVQMLTVESYPTVIRNIGYGFQNTPARIGAIVGPQMVYLDTFLPGIMYYMCCAFSLLCILAALALPETMDRDLTDMIDKPEKTNKQPESHDQDKEYIHENSVL